MIQSQVQHLAYQPSEIGDENRRTFEFTFPRRARHRAGKLHLPSGLVASYDEKVLQNLACPGGESKRIVDRHEVCLVLCDDHLVDGNYKDILSAAERSRAKTPVVVVSRTGDWPDYLKAITAGVFDYLAFPPILGELPRAIRNAMAWRMANSFRDTATKISNSSRGEMS